MRIRELIEGVTFREFRELAIREGWTTQKLTDELKGKFGGPVHSDFYERPLRYFEQVLSPDRRKEEIVIPYLCIIELYIAVTRLEPTDRTKIVTRRCACGCGSAVWRGRRYAARTCQQRGPASRTAAETGRDDHKHPDDPGSMARVGVPEGLATRDIASERVIDSEYVAPSVSRVPSAQTNHSCEECGGGFPWSGKGPRPRRCGDRCRKRAERRRLRDVGKSP